MWLVNIFLGTLLGFGVSLWVVSNWLNKSNNIGDSTGDFNNYGRDLKVTVEKNKISGKERKQFSEVIENYGNSSINGSQNFMNDLF